MVTFAEQELSNVSFRGAWLPTSDFVGAKLSGADFAHAKGELDGRGADMTNAHLSFVDLTKWTIDQSTKIDGISPLIRSSSEMHHRSSLLSERCSASSMIV